MSKEFLNQRQYTIAPTAADDVEAMNTMLKKVWLDTYPNEDHGVTSEWVEHYFAIRSLPEAIEGRKGFIQLNENNPAMISLLVKDRAGDVIAATHGYKDERGMQHLGMLNVDSDYHGTGVAHDLINRVIEWSDPEQPLYLGVVKYNERAQRFYAKHGFVAIEGSDTMFADMMPEITMVRKGDQQ